MMAVRVEGNSGADTKLKLKDLCEGEFCLRFEIAENLARQHCTRFTQLIYFISGHRSGTSAIINNQDYQ